MECAVSTARSGFDVEPNMIDVHAAIAITDQLAVSSSGSWGRAYGPQTRIKQWDKQGNHISTTVLIPWQFDTELALGYFRPAGSKNIYEVYAGMGYSEQWTRKKMGDAITGEVFWSFDDKRHAYNRYFIQQAWGRNGEILDRGFVLRSSIIQYANSEMDFLLEPGYMIRFGYKNVKFMFQYNMLVHTNNTAYSYPDYPVIVSGGVYIMLNNHTFNFRKAP